MTIQVFGIPNCGTCKKALKWLEENNISYEFINTKENPPSQEMIKSWVNSLSAKPMRNTSGKSYRALGKDRATWSDDKWIEEFSKDVMLLKRPLFVREGKALLVGFRGSEAEIKAKLE